MTSQADIDKYNANLKLAARIDMKARRIRKAKGRIQNSLKQSPLRYKGSSKLKQIVRHSRGPAMSNTNNNPDNPQRRKDFSDLYILKITQTLESYIK